METSRLRRSIRKRRKNKSPAEELPQTTISDLPEAILLHILSFLPTIDAIRTTVVAPPWLNLWKSLTNLDFDLPYFQKPIPVGKTNRLGRQSFAEFVAQALLRSDDESAPLQKFKMRFSNRFSYRIVKHIRAYVKEWAQGVVRLVVRRGVVKLDLDFADCGVADFRLLNDDGEEAGVGGYPGRQCRFYTGDTVYKFGHGLSYSNIW